MLPHDDACWVGKADRPILADDLALDVIADPVPMPPLFLVKPATALPASRHALSPLFLLFIMKSTRAGSASMPLIT